MSPAITPAAATGSHTIVGPQEYWDRYYAQQFRFGLGTEDILAALMRIPLFGLCRDAEHFADCSTAAHQLVTPGGWAAGANWAARNPHQRVELTERLYQVAAARAGIELLLTRQVPITADPDFTAVWTYIGRKHRHGHRGARHAVSATRRATAAG